MHHGAPNKYINKINKKNNSYNLIFCWEIEFSSPILHPWFSTYNFTFISLLNNLCCKSLSPHWNGSCQGCEWFLNTKSNVFLSKITYPKRKNENLPILLLYSSSLPFFPLCVCSKFYAVCALVYGVHGSMHIHTETRRHWVSSSVVLYLFLFFLKEILLLNLKCSVSAGCLYRELLWYVHLCPGVTDMRCLYLENWTQILLLSQKPFLTAPPPKPPPEPSTTKPFLSPVPIMESPFTAFILSIL